MGSSSSPSEGVNLVSQPSGATEGFWPAEGPLPTSPPSNKLKFFGVVPYSSHPQYELTFCPRPLVPMFSPPRKPFPQPLWSAHPPCRLSSEASPDLLSLGSKSLLCFLQNDRFYIRAQEFRSQAISPRQESLEGGNLI